MTELIETDVLIIGCGIAGCTAALELADAGISVTVVTRAKDPKKSNTYYAQGGIIYKGINDSKASLAEDITRAGAGHCNPRAVDILSEQGPELLKKILLDRVGVEFDCTADGELSLVREGGHSIPRIVHATDITGRAIEIALMRALVAHPKITLLTAHTAIDLLTPSHHSLNRLSIYEPRSCVGAYVLNRTEGRVIRCLAKNTILATGGLGKIFLRSTNPRGARGDGIAMAYRAGARVINTEFIQFHPTTFYQTQAPRFLISEAVRGEGARLVHANGEPFMQNYNAEWKDLAPRDIVARCIHEEMLKNDISNVYLDLRSYIPTPRIREHFPNIHETCLGYGIDITRDLVPVVPASHYSCGGVWVDQWGETTIRHLYSVGEVACTGLHGANRLASTSLLEGLVWGSISARRILHTLPDQSAPRAADIPLWYDNDGMEMPDPALISQDMSYVKHIMWNYVGLVRTSVRLKRAMRELRNLEIETERFYRVIRLTDSLIGVRNAVRTAIIVTSAAWENKRSMGCHYRK
ncbi:L-aspartate oxidase [Desulfonema magnum]|uniref:L-aspartate oxidase n=1 Tax=Desulfonema magnum TaxID=45655 RepID=A0A975BNN5_9BACT|nr:L-aspartate oxidase [Desulfonema magnum]QTA88790.1 L-aspartate oxidase [Desulfonema magnum]